jgi:hypothetical protein
MIVRSEQHQTTQIALDVYERKKLFHNSVVNELHFMSQGHAPDVTLRLCANNNKISPPRLEARKKETFLSLSLPRCEMFNNP